MLTSTQILNKWLIGFVLEATRKQDSCFYPPETVYNLLCGMYHHLVSLLRLGTDPNFMAKDDPLFKELIGATSYVPPRRCRHKSQAELITMDEEG